MCWGWKQPLTITLNNSFLEPTFFQIPPGPPDHQSTAKEIQT